MFCESVVQRARIITNCCAGNKDFRECFDDISPSKVRDALTYYNPSPMADLFHAIRELKELISSFEKRPEDIPLLVVVLDEVASLLKDKNPVKYIALNRIISCLSDLATPNVWYLFLSTETKISDLLPPDSTPNGQSVLHRPSSRMGDVKLGRFPPFTSFVVDIPDLKKDYKHKPAEQKMSQFVEPSHMAIFGRPLWSAYKSDQVLSVAKAKILGGKDHLQFNSTDPNHVFALLSVRLGLDVDLANPKALPLSQSAVHLHMRMVDWVDPATGVMATSTPSEPILSLAARQYLIADKYLWQQTIITFRAELLDKVVLDKGLAGELYARLILTLARDALGHKADLTFTVKEFLEQLYQKKYHSKIATIDPEILESSMNFLSFSSTKQMLPARKSLQPLLYVLLRRTSALQLAPLQSHLDQIVPFYMGKADEPFNWKKTGAIVIQVKNRKRPVNVSQVLQESFLRADEEQPRRKTRGSSKKGANPLRTTPPGPKFLFMLLDLDAGKTGLDVSISQADDPIIWAIQSKGHDKNLFRCLETLGVELAALRFFKDSSAETPDIGFVHHKDQLYNILYHDKIVTEDDDV